MRYYHNKIKNFNIRQVSKNCIQVRLEFSLQSDTENYSILFNRVLKNIELREFSPFINSVNKNEVK